MPQQVTTLPTCVLLRRCVAILGWRYRKTEAYKPHIATVTWCIQAAENQSSSTVNFNNVCFPVATSPTCTVDKPSAASSEDVTYICSVMPVCGMIDVPLTMEKDGNTQATHSNSVTWTSRAGSIANSIITCMSAVQCPSVNITGELTVFISRPRLSAGQLLYSLL